MKHLLFPTDFSPLANHAFTYALAFANHYEMRITVLHAFHYQTIEARLAPVEVLKDLHSSQKEEAFEKFMAYRREAEEANFQDLSIEPMITSGFAADMILEASEKLTPDFILMGCKGDGGITDRIFGKVTLRIMRDALCPVLAIPEKSSFSPLGILFYAAASEAESDKMKAKLESLSRGLHSELSHVHVAVQDNKHIAQKLGEIIAQLQADAVVLSPHHHSFVENLFHASITEQLTEELEVPIIAIH